MHELYELKDKLLQELEEYGAKELSAGTLDVVDKLSHAVKNLCKIIEMKEEEGEYSGDYRGGMMRPYMGGSYARDGRDTRDGGSYRGGSYARGRNARRDSMGRYSSEMGYSRDGEDLARQIRDLMAEAPDEHIRRDMEKLLRKVEQM